MAEEPALEGQTRRMLLSDVDVRAISMVKKGANGQRIFLFKSAADDDDAGDDLAVRSRIIKAGGDEWSTFYIVVAEPGREEEPGIATDDQSIRDVWASEDEIRKAAHGFMHNGALINKMHEDFEPYGKLVENAVAPCDLTVAGPDGDEQVIKKGSWYIGIEPSVEGKAMVESGEFTGVSIQGSGQRTPASFDGPELSLIKPKLAKGTPSFFTDYDRDQVAEILAEPIEKGSSAALPDLDWSAAENWIDRLPAAMGAAFKRSWIYRAAKHLTFEVYGGNRGHAFAVAIEAARKGCATGDLNFPGAQQVNPGSRAEMCAAVSLWESMKATNAAQKLTKEAEEAIAKMDAAAAGIDSEDVGRFRKVLEFFGVVEPPAEVESGELAKETGTTKPMSETATTGTEKTVEERLAALEPLAGRVDGIEKSVKDLTDLDLGGKLEAIAKRLPEPEEKAPTVTEIGEAVSELAKSTNEQIAKLAGAVEQLAEGDSTQTGDELAELAKGGGGGEPTYESSLLG